MTTDLVADIRHARTQKEATDADVALDFKLASVEIVLVCQINWLQQLRITQINLLHQKLI